MTRPAYSEYAPSENGTVVGRFAVTDSMITVPIAGGHVLTVPTTREARAFTDMCPGCGALRQRPATFLITVDPAGRPTGRLASYRCNRRGCNAAWICGWLAPVKLPGDRKRRRP